METTAMELKPNEIKALKVDAITKAIQSIDRAMKASTSGIIQEVYATQARYLEDWRSQIKAEPEPKK